MSNNPASDQNIKLNPPSGDPSQAEKYITRLIQLIEKDKLSVNQTDLNKFDPGTLQDHYRIDLDEYQVEVSHSKHPNSGKDSYIILFNNLKMISADNCEKVILAYMHLEKDQFIRFKEASLANIQRFIRFEEERKLKDALKQVDKILNNLEDKNLQQSPLHSLMAVS